MHILLISIGTGGDTLPFIHWGQTLQARGHDVTVLANGAYRKVADERGVPFVELISADEHRRRCAQRDKSPRDWLKSGLANMLADVRTVYGTIDRYRQPDTVVAASTLCMGARLAQEKWNIPLATVAYSQLLFSMRDPMTWIGRSPRWVSSAVRYVIFRIGDRALRSPLNSIRNEIGLPALNQPVLKWWHSPDRVIGFFPEWFAAPQPDWPPNVLPVGFALPDASIEPPLSNSVEEFLAAGSLPLVFSYSTALNTSLSFYREAIAIAKQLDQRAILLSPPEELTRNLPSSILAAPAEAHLRLFPRARMAVHHAGIGSTAAALWSGIPQFHVPYGVDQPENAERCKRLGVSNWVKLTQFQARRAAPVIERMLHDAALIDRCRKLAEQSTGFLGLARASDAIEALSRRNNASHGRS